MYMDDLAALDLLSEEAIVDQLQNRYEQTQIYTYIGDILVAVNPFTNLGLYTGFVSYRPDLVCVQFELSTRVTEIPEIFTCKITIILSCVFETHVLLFTDEKLTNFPFVKF